MFRKPFLLLAFTVSLGQNMIFTQEVQKSTDMPTDIVGELPEKEDLDIDESTETYKSGTVKISEAMLEKIQEMEEIAKEEKGQNNDIILERLLGKLWSKILLMRFNDEFIEALADESIDWRVRFAMIRVKSEFVTNRKINKYMPALLKILADKKANPQVRGTIAHAVSKAIRNKNNDEARKVLTDIAFDKETPGELMQHVWSVLGSIGIDDVSRIEEIMYRKPGQDINDIGINLSAVRALCPSKDPKAVDLIIKILDISSPDAFFNVIAIEELTCVVFYYPERRAELDPIIVPKLLKLVDDRSYRGASRRDAANLLIRMGVKEVYEPITKWFLPVKGEIAEQGKGGGRIDFRFGAKFLAELCDKRGIKVLENVLKNFPTDSRWAIGKEWCEEKGLKFPEDDADYKTIKKRLEKLKNCTKPTPKAMWEE